MFPAGLLKPGLNYEAGEKKEVKNNIPAMKQKLAEMQSTKLNWVESRMKQTEVNWRKAIFSTISRDRCSSTGRLKQLCWKGCRGFRVLG